MKTTAQGRKAEAAVAKLLTEQGFKVIELNWRQPVCEIDIVAQKDAVVHFCEVKYRSSADQGDGFEYITPKKLSQMQFAGQVWIQSNDWSGDWRLLAAAVSGTDCEQIQLLEL